MNLGLKSEFANQTMLNFAVRHLPMQSGAEVLYSPLNATKLKMDSIPNNQLA